MSSPKKSNTCFQVTISKQVYADLNGIVAAINQTREDKISRSQFIEALIIDFIMRHIKPEETTKGDN